MGNAGGAGRRIAGQFLYQPHQFARRAAVDQLAAMDRADPGAVIAAVLHPAQAIDQPLRHLFLADDANNAAHFV